MKHTVVKKERNGCVMRVRRSSGRHMGRKSRTGLCVLAAVLVAVLMADFGLFLGFAEDGVKNSAVEQVDESVQEPTVSAKPAPVLLDEAPADKLCIGVLLTGTGGIMKYYVPDAAVQQELYKKISGLDVDKIKAAEIVPEWCRDAWDYNIVVKYGEFELQLKEGGVMLITRWQDYVFTEWVARDTEVGEYILDIVRNDIGLQAFDSASIDNIVKAELMTGPMYTGEARESVVLTDSEKLAKIETLFSGAGKSFWSKCPFGNCQLVLTTAAGEEITLAVACDSCTMFYANGCFYDYMPAEYRHAEDHPDNTIFFELFGITPDYFQNT